MESVQNLSKSFRNLERVAVIGPSEVEVGAVVWNLIAQPRRVTEIRDALLERYDVEADRCGRELIDLLGALHERGLIQVAEGRTDDDETDR